MVCSNQNTSYHKKTPHNDRERTFFDKRLTFYLARLLRDKNGV